MIGYLCGGVISGKKSRELMNFIMTSDEAREGSEFLSALNASLQSFVHKTLKDEQIECIHGIACNGRDVLAVLPTGLGKSSSAMYVFIPPFSLIRNFRKQNTRGIVSKISSNCIKRTFPPRQKIQGTPDRRLV